MRIAYICADPGVPVFGTKGCSIHVQEIVRSMMQRGDEVELFVAREGGKPPQDLESCVVHELKIPMHPDTRSREVEQVLWNQRVSAALDRQCRFDLVYERYSLWSAKALRWAKRKGIPSILEVNAPLIDEQALHRELVQSYLANVFAKQAMRNATAVYTVSDAIVPYCHRFMSKRDAVRVIPNGVDTVRFSPGITPIDPFVGFTIGFVGSLKLWHGVDLLVESFARLIQLTQLSANGSHPPDDCRLVIVGDGPQRTALEKQLEDRVDIQNNVKFAGAVTADSVPGWISSMDVTVAPYPELEDFYFSPLKIYEYMASGRAVLASATGQINDVIEHRTNGLLYQPNNLDQLVASLLLLRNSRALRATLGQAARLSALQHSWQRVLEQALALVQTPSTESTNLIGTQHELSV